MKLQVLLDAYAALRAIQSLGVANVPVKEWTQCLRAASRIEMELILMDARIPVETEEHA